MGHLPSPLWAAPGFGIRRPTNSLCLPEVAESRPQCISSESTPHRMTLEREYA
jgi:hypothetical protein